MVATARPHGHGLVMVAGFLLPDGMDEKRNQTFHDDRLALVSLCSFLGEGFKYTKLGIAKTCRFSIARDNVRRTYIYSKGSLATSRTLMGESRGF